MRLANLIVPTTCAAALATSSVALAAPRVRSARRPASAAPAAGIVRLELEPSRLLLDGPRSVQHLVVTAIGKDGSTRDVTEEATFTVSRPGLTRIAVGNARPVRDGEARLVARLGRLASRPSTLSVRNARTPAPVSFVNDVMPILAKAGCNSTACHGSPAGKGGLKLSLFGYEPDLDHPALVKDADGRRIELKEPGRSLLILKPTGQLPHGGGRRFKPGSPEYTTLLAWLKSGAPGPGELEPKVARLEVAPSEPVMPAPGARQRLIVTAVMSDGSERDVTDGALYSSNDDGVAAVNDGGVVTAARPGETAVMVRYLGQVAVARIGVLPPWKAPVVREPAGGYIDQHIGAKLRRLRLAPSELCTDAEFMRRAYQDVLGVIPTPEEVRAFTQNRSPDRRVRLVDALLERPEFVDLWTLLWDDILRNNPRLTRAGVGPFHTWIREQIAKNRPYDEFVRDLLTATGKNSDVPLEASYLPPALRGRRGVQLLLNRVNGIPFDPAASYYAPLPNPLDVTSATSQLFLGVRIECARCHNHPFEKWTQSDYYGLASFFSGLRVQGRQPALPTVVLYDDLAPRLRHPKTNEPVEPRVLDGEQVTIEPGDPRTALAGWITSPRNPWFARAIVNRLWAHYFGRGIVDPVDDFRATNPPSNPALLDALARDLSEHGFDLKRVHRAILTSRAYQRSSKPNPYNREDRSSFARFYPRRMIAETLYDSIGQATDVPLNVPGRQARGRGMMMAAGPAQPILRSVYDALPEGPVTRVTQLPVTPQAQRRGPAGGVGLFLDTFGRPKRETLGDCDRSADGNIGQALTLINGDEVNQKIRHPLGRVHALAGTPGTDAEIVTELYLAALSRPPDRRELKAAGALLAAAPSRTEGLEDLMWSLLNSREFLFIH
jgi:hypothetical protein